MSGENLPLITIGPGVNRSSTQYAAGASWFNANLVRWINNVLVPIGGWQTAFDVETVGARPIRDIFTWRDYLKNAWIALGSANALTCVSANTDGSYTQYDATPASLIWADGPLTGYGAGPYGAGPFSVGGIDLTVDSVGQWSFDNWGRNLLGVHSQDGRLFQWDPTSPATIAAPVAGAPIDNTLVICTDEEFAMVLGGKNNPRRVQWCSRRDISDWVASTINSAGGFEIQSNGSIIAAVKIQGGILVLTDTDVHIIEYIGPPNYYGRRRISSEGGIIGKNSIASMPGRVMWADHSNFWLYDGNIVRMDCPVFADVFYNSDLSRKSRVFMGNNEFAQEIWTFYPGKGEDEANMYVVFSYGSVPYWTIGSLSRTAFEAPVYSTRPIAASNVKIYDHERGWTNDGVSRNGDVWIETGALELKNGNRSARLDRIYQDGDVIDDPIFYGMYGEIPSPSDPVAYNVTFKLKQSPTAEERIKGPFTLNISKGYTTLRMRARQFVMRIDQISDGFWVLGNVRLRMKEAGKR